MYVRKECEDTFESTNPADGINVGDETDPEVLEALGEQMEEVSPKAAKKKRRPSPLKHEKKVHGSPRVSPAGYLPP